MCRVGPLICGELGWDVGGGEDAEGKGQAAAGGPLPSHSLFGHGTLRTRNLNLSWPSRSLWRHICQSRRGGHILFNSLIYNF